MFFRNILIQLIFIISLAVFVSFTFLLPILNSLWLEQTDYLEKIEIYRSAGPVSMLVEHLNTIDQDEQIEALNGLQSKFNYELMLKTKDQLSFTSQQSEILALGQTLFIADKTELYHQLNDEGLVLIVGDMDTADQIHQSPKHDEITAVLNLIFQELLVIPSTEWLDRIKQIDQYFAVSIEMTTLNDPKISEIQRTVLLNQDIVFQYFDPKFQRGIPEYILKKIPNHDTVVSIGPLYSVIEESVNNDILLRFFILIGISLFLPVIIWLLPSWRTSASLLKATKQFGNGDLSSRSSIFKGSNLNGLAVIFNKMAKKVETLYDNNIMLNSAVSHELRTPLTRIEFAIELLRNPSSKQSDKQINRIENAITEMRIMSDEMELYARFDQEQPSFEFVTTDLTTWFNENNQEWIDNKHFTTISITHLSPEILVNIERFYFKRMIDNVIRNAYKHASTSIRIHTKILGNQCLISIGNDGPSIDDEYKNKVFEPFFRLDHSRSRNSGGTGLGLAIVKQIVLWHHGSVWIEDCSIGGVNVKITIPIVVPR
ncbi:ATP-binding protein [Aliivibrio kagoshimensis]|uniref:ATP-binding protein n=1 Tax=Aliivibrio kagoshimensis TaxID=2910230 RepID=UPI003D0CF0BF